MKLSQIISKLEEKGLHKSAENVKKVVGLRRQKTTFRVAPKAGKMKHYKDLNEIAKDFTFEEVYSSQITVIFGTVVIGEINGGSLANCFVRR